MLDVQVLLLLVLVAGGAGYDITQRRVPNRLTVSVAVAGLAVNTYAGGLSGLGSAAVGALVGMGFLFIPFALGMVGAGDVKFLGAAGAVTGPVFVTHGALVGFLWGGVFAVCVLLWRGEVFTLLKRLWQRGVFWIYALGTRTAVATLHVAEAQREDKDGNQLYLPYAVALGLGLLTVLVVEVLAPTGNVGGSYVPVAR